MSLRSALLLIALVFLPRGTYAAPFLYDANGHYYEYVEPGSSTWQEAMTIAESMSFMGVTGHLATVTSVDEFDFVFWNGPALPVHVWLGAFQSESADAPDNGWQWVTGEVWDYTNWGDAQPDDASGDERYLMIMLASVRTSVEDAWPWHDQMGDATSHGFIVEYDVPEPSIALMVLLAISVHLRIAARRDAMVGEHQDAADRCRLVNFTVRRELMHHDNV